jgi:phenylacetic acid degradation operon negative regulatory protein
MPPGWPRAGARALFVAIYDGLAEQAQDHVREIVARCGEHPHAGIRAHTVAEMAGAGRSAQPARTLP